MIEAVIYDMDGILIDSEPNWRRAEIEVFGAYGVTLTEEDCLKTLGFRIDEVEDYWFDRKPWPNRVPGELSEKIVDKMVEFVLASGTPMKGVEHSLKYFAKLNLPLAVASSSHLRLINASLKSLGISNYFKVICSAEQEAFGKPHPAVFIKAAKLLGVDPDKCLVIEDSPSGVIAARAAKMRIIAVPEEHNRSRKEIAIADYVLDSLEEVDNVKL